MWKGGGAIIVLADNGFPPRSRCGPLPPRTVWRSLKLILGRNSFDNINIFLFRAEIDVEEGGVRGKTATNTTSIGVLKQKYFEVRRGGGAVAVGVGAVAVGVWAVAVGAGAGH